MTTAAPDDRRRELAQIHIAKKQLGLEDDTYRAMLRAIGRVESAGDLNAEGRRQVLAHLKSRGFKPAQSTIKSPANTEWAWVDRAAAERRPLLKKLIMELKDAGRPKAYADGVAKRMFAIERVELCAPDQLHKIVSALVIDRQRRARKANAAR